MLPYYFLYIQSLDVPELVTKRRKIILFFFFQQYVAICLNVLSVK